MTLIESARKLVGTRFVLGQGSPVALDCFGLVLLTLQDQGLCLGRERNEWPLAANISTAHEALIGLGLLSTQGPDFVALMRVPRAQGACHFGIVGEGRIVSASMISERVIETTYDLRLQELTAWRGFPNG
jgi:hypothetical protein